MQSTPGRNQPVNTYTSCVDPPNKYAARMTKESPDRLVFARYARRIEEPRYMYKSIQQMMAKRSVLAGYTLAFISGESILSSTFLISLFVCSASVRVRIY